MIKISIAGDICSRDRGAEVIQKGDYSQYFKTVKDILEDCDYSLVNLECPIIDTARPIKKQGPNLKAPQKIINLIKYCGLDGVTLANNHFYDYGDDGVISTINICKKHNIDFVGGGENIEIARNILYKTINNKTIAFINACEYEFSIATETTAGSNPMDPIRIYNDIKDAKEEADYVVVIIHGGHEHYNLPSPRMQDMYRFFIDAGADAVVNHHQHCYSGYEYYKGKPIVYGLGNFYFDHPKKRNDMWNEGYMVCLEFNKVISLSLIPYIQCNDKPSIELMKNDQTMVFHENINKLNEIIQNRDALESHFDRFCQAKRRLYMSVLEPYPSIYLKYLNRKSLLPSLLRGRSYLFVKNFIMCESHIDVIRNLLKKDEL